MDVGYHRLRKLIMELKRLSFMYVKVIRIVAIMYYLTERTTENQIC